VGKKCIKWIDNARRMEDGRLPEEAVNYQTEEGNVCDNRQSDEEV
jgi:hypothetical protein